MRRHAITLVAIVLTTNAHSAPARYTYVDGPLFGDIGSPGFEGFIPNLVGISGYFELSQAVGPNSVYQSEAHTPDTRNPVTAVWFSDGNTTISSLDQVSDWGFGFRTDEHGDIVEWGIGLSNQGQLFGQGIFRGMNTQFGFGAPSGTGQDQTRYCSFSPVNDSWMGCISITSQIVATTDANKGSWTTTIVPIPGAAWLMLSALGILGAIRARLR